MFATGAQQQDQPCDLRGHVSGTSLSQAAVAAVRGLLTSALLILVMGCGARGSADAPLQITALNPAPAQAASSKPTTIRGSVIDGATHRPVQLAHVSYDGQVTATDANGAFSIAGVRAGQRLAIVAADYRRYTGVWNAARPQVALAPFEARGLYLPFAGLSDPVILRTIDRYSTNSEINTIVLEVKTDDGEVSAQMATPAAVQANATVDGLNVKGFIDRMHERGIYMVGRFVVFRDPTLARVHPEWALKRSGDGQPYSDEQGERWIDAFRQEVWEYNLDLAEKAAQLGLDEVQFDYVRFPGTNQDLNYAESETQENRVAAISGFLKRAERRLRPYGVAIGADAFGLTTVATDDTGIGQDIQSLAQYLDYFCPMVYPSTWADGSLGIDYPPADPYTIVHDSVLSAVRRLASVPTVRVRPWLQAFDDYKKRRIEYSPERVNIQKDAAARAGGAGWMLWDPAAEYAAGEIGSTNSGSKQ